MIHQRLSRATVAMLAVGLLSTASGCGGSDDKAEPSTANPSPSQSSTFDVSGELTILNNGTGIEQEGESCSTNESYFSDLALGAPVVVRGSTGNELALGRLPEGEAHLNGSVSTGMSMAFHDCVIAFTIPDVKSGEPVYQISIGDRDPIRFTEAEADTISLSIDTGAETQ